MGYVVRRVIVYPKSGDIWDETSGTEITDAFSVEVRKGTGSIKNTFTFKVPNGKDYFQSETNPFISENLVKIWIKRDSTSFADTDLIIEGTINEVSQSIDDSGDVLLIKGNDFTEVFFDVQNVFNYTSKTWVEIAQSLINELRRTNAKEIYWASSAEDYVGTPNPTVKSDGSSFPQKNLILNYTKIYEVIEKITSDEFTEDGQYVYWLEKQGTKYFLVCRFKSNTITGTITEGNDNFQTKISKKKEDIKNYIVYNCGNDLYGNAVEDFYCDLTSAGKYGYKFYYCTEQTGNFFRNVLDYERFYPTKTASFNPGTDGKPQDDSPTSYNYTFITSGVTVANKNAFNDEVKRIALILGYVVAKGIADRSSKPQYALEINYRFTNAYNIGELWQCNFPSRNINRPLRIEEIRYKVDEVTLNFTEDEAKATFD